MNKSIISDGEIFRVQHDLIEAFFSSFNVDPVSNGDDYAFLYKHHWRKWIYAVDANEIGMKLKSS